MLPDALSKHKRKIKKIIAKKLLIFLRKNYTLKISYILEQSPICLAAQTCRLSGTFSEPRHKIK